MNQVHLHVQLYYSGYLIPTRSNGNWPKSGGQHSGYEMYVRKKWKLKYKAKLNVNIYEGLRKKSQNRNSERVF